ncbi:YfiT family bacillithiol transferase [Desertivirga xinjiangensis]|uniref:YfiT family bacillithiol transferase n=1 Tax=Desertivirga xinjiangensis TaxID=539206 RepID=UPI00210871B1|nr:putative metal-dependent hydrolase [Pedobacter xinjiangensis]
MNHYTQQYPIGKFEKPPVITSTILSEWILFLENFPSLLAQEVSHLSDRQLNTPYRDGGWSLRQVVHHCADSHINAFCRIKLAITENTPEIKPYYEERWAELADSKTMPIEASLNILKGLHQRWVILLKSLSDEILEKTFIHPEHQKAFNLAETIGTYAWHSRHHLAHITELKKSKGWQ